MSKQYNPGLQTWKARLQDAFETYFEFEALSELYDLHSQLGFDSPTIAWEANPYIQGSGNIKDFKRIDGKATQ